MLNKQLMETINHTRLQRETKSILDAVSNDKETIIVHRPKSEDVVMIPISEWNAWNETLYLLSTKKNREALEESINQMDDGKTKKYNSIDDMFNS